MFMKYSQKHFFKATERDKYDICLTSRNFPRWISGRFCLKFLKFSCTLVKVLENFENVKQISVKIDCVCPFGERVVLILQFLLKEEILFIHTIAC